MGGTLQRGGERKCRRSREPQRCCFKCGSSLFDSRQRLQSVSGASAGGTSARSFSVLISPPLLSSFLSFCLLSLSFASNPVKIFFKSSHWLAEGLSLWAAAEPVSACERRLLWQIKLGWILGTTLGPFLGFFFPPYMSWDCFILGNRIRHTSILILRRFAMS